MNEKREQEIEEAIRAYPVPTAVVLGYRELQEELRELRRRRDGWRDLADARSHETVDLRRQLQEAREGRDVSRRVAREGRDAHSREIAELRRQLEEVKNVFRSMIELGGGAFK